MALNGAKVLILFGRVKRQSQVWCTPKVENAESERRKAFTAAHRSDKDHQAYIFASRHASSVIAEAKAEI